MFIAIFGAMAIIGWITGNRALAGGVHGLLPMAPNTGVVFVLLGVALCAVGVRARYAERIAYVVTGLTLTIATARLLEYLTGTDLSVDRWFLSVPSESIGLAPLGRMAFFTALSFICAGVALLASIRGRAGSAADDLARALSLLTCTGGAIFLLGYVYTSPLVFSGRSIPMALPTAIAFVVLGLSIWVPSVQRAGIARAASATALERTRRLFATAFEYAPHGIAVVDLDGRLLQVNGTLCELTGYDESELLARTSLALTHPDDRMASVVLADRLLSGEIPSYRIEKRYIRKDGALVSTLSSRSIVRDGAGVPLYFIVHIEDITPRRDAERAAREREALYRTFARHFPHGAVVLFDREKRFLFVDGHDTAAVGLAPWAMVGRLPHECFDAARCAAMVPAMEAALLGQETDTDVVEGMRHVRRFCGPVPGPEGGVAFGMFLLQDVTERKRLEMEVRAQTEELARSNEELERFAYVASHDLQEPLRMVTSYTQLLKKRYHGKLDADADTFITYAVDGASRMQQLIRDLLAYSRVNTQGGAFATVDLEHVMRSVLQDLAIRIGESGAEVTHDPLPVVTGDATQLRQVLQNLVDNALKYQRPGAIPRVHLRAVRQKIAWEITVTDNGIGIASEFHERIFVIFQRLHTREVYAGTGLGLALARRVAERHGGRLWVDSDPAHGSTFHLLLPLSATERAIQGSPDIDVELGGADARVLVAAAPGISTSRPL